jgi:uncharacterized protein YeaO (DUF488 family)
MIARLTRNGLLVGTFLAGFCGVCLGQEIIALPVDKWVTATGEAAGTDATAKDQAVAAALRKAVEQACGVFLTSQSKSQDYKTVYDKIFANTVGYVIEHKEPRIVVENGVTKATVTARVSTQKFEKDWAVIAHTLEQENNPRLIVVIAETTEEMVNKLAEETTSGSETVTAGTVEGGAGVTSAHVAEATRLGEAYVWVDGRGRRWRRDGGVIHCISGEQVTAAEAAAAESHFKVVFSQVTATKSSASRKVWESVAKSLEEKGAVQGRIEEFFLSKGVKLMDRDTTRKVNKRDLMLAMAKDDLSEVKALGAKFEADVIIFGTAAAKYAREISVGDATMHQYSSKLAVRAIRTDSGQLIVSKVFGPVTQTSTLKSGGEEKALDKLAEDSAPKLLAAVVEAWRKQINVSRDIRLHITGMEHEVWKLFKAEAEKLDGVQALRLREITEGVATIDVEYKFTTENLADRVTELKSVKLKVVEISANRIKLKVAQ